MSKWVCENPECRAEFSEYVSGCPCCYFSVRKVRMSYERQENEVIARLAKRVAELEAKEARLQAIMESTSDVGKAAWKLAGEQIAHAKVAELEVENARLKKHAEAMAEAMHNTRTMLSKAVRMVECEMGKEGRERWSGTNPIDVVADLYGRMGPMCQQLDPTLAAYRRDYPKEPEVSFAASTRSGRSGGSRSGGPA